MRARQVHLLFLALTVAIGACRHSFTQQDALTAIQRHDSLRVLLAPDSERVAHETVLDCRAIYSENPDTAHMAGDSAWILLSSAGWMDLADVDAPSDARQKKHCRAVLTSKANKAAFQAAPDANGTPWTSYWAVETARAKLELVGIPDDSKGSSAVADFEITRERTPIGDILHRPRWSDASAHPFSMTVTGHFRYSDGGWRVESFEEKQ